MTSESGRASQPRPVTVAHIALLLPWVTAIVAARLPVRDNSFLWHVTAGRLQTELGAVLTMDPFSFTRLGTPWRTQSWLLELAYSLLDDRVGLAFVMPFLAVCAFLMFGLVLLSTFAVTRSVEATALTGVLSAWVAAAFLNPRPVLVSYVFLAATVAVVATKKARWTLPLISWIWAAVHGSFILGIGLMVLVGLKDRDREALGLSAAMALTATATAHGIGTWDILLDFAKSQPALDLITEWATPDFTALPLLPFLIGIFLLVVAGVRGRLSPAHLWLVGPFLLFSMTATRAVLPAWLVLSPWLGLAMVGVRASSERSRRHRNALVGIAIGLVVFPFLLPVDPGPLSDEFPVHAVERLDPGPVFHDDFVGGYLIYAAGPERPVFVDDRAELYGAGMLSQMIDARNGIRWERLFRNWGIEQAIVHETYYLATELGLSGWTRVTRDGDWILFRRSSGALES